VTSGEFDVPPANALNGEYHTRTPVSVAVGSSRNVVPATTTPFVPTAMAVTLPSPSSGNGGPGVQALPSGEVHDRPPSSLAAGASSR